MEFMDLSLDGYPATSMHFIDTSLSHQSPRPCCLIHIFKLAYNFNELYNYPN